MEQLGVDEVARLKAISICRRHFRPTPRCDMAVSIRLSNRFSPRNHFHPPVLICCQIMFTSVIPTRALRARDYVISGAPAWAPGLSTHAYCGQMADLRTLHSIYCTFSREHLFGQGWPVLWTLIFFKDAYSVGLRGHLFG